MLSGCASAARGQGLDCKGIAEANGSFAFAFALMFVFVVAVSAAPVSTTVPVMPTGTVAGVHKHFGAAHAFILEGGFGYEHGEVFEGDYLVEAGGITHQPFTGPKGVTMLGFMFGPLGGMDDNGNLAGVLDIDWHYQTAKANGAADHIVRKVADTH